VFSRPSKGMLFNFVDSYNIIILCKYHEYSLVLHIRHTRVKHITYTHPLHTLVRHTHTHIRRVDTPVAVCINNNSYTAVVYYTKCARTEYLVMYGVFVYMYVYMYIYIYKYKLLCDNTHTSA